MKNKLLVSLFALVIATSAFSQSLPSEMSFSANGRMLTRGWNADTGWYHKDSIRSIYINFPQSNYWTLLQSNYASETEIPATMVVNGITYDSVGVRFRGNTSYTQIGSSQKKSFAISLDFVHENQRIMGYKNVKLNNSHQDSTFMREVMYCRMSKKYTPIAKASYVRLFINNVDWGIYPNVQQIDKTYLEQWFMSNDGARFRATNEETGTPTPGWGDGTAGMNYLGADTSLYLPYYDLKSSDIDSGWHKLVAACSTLSIATASNKDLVKSKIDIDKALWFLACENIFTDDDSYVYKGKMDYYVYYEPETGRTTPLEYDGNSSFQSSLATSTQWGVFKNATNANYPLLNKLLNIPEWRQRYLAHYRTILNETFTTANATAIVDELNGKIATLVANDTKKLYSTAAYTASVPRIKTFVTNRRAYLLSNTEVAQVAPTIAEAPYYNSAMSQYTQPVTNEVVNIRAKVSHTSGLNKVVLYYTTGVVGNFNTTQMYDDGTHNDSLANDGVYGAQIPGYIANTLVRYYIEAVANNASLSAAYLPVGAEHDVFVYKVAEPPVTANGVVVNEIVASNSNGAKDEANDYEDWFELYNKNSYSVNLGKCYLTDDTTTLNKWQIPAGTSIAANGYLIFWADNELTEGPLHTNFKLSASGESVVLCDSALNILDKVVFGTQTTNMGYARMPNGTGSFVIQTPTFNANNETVTPVKLIVFSGYKNADINVLSWTTTNEINNKGFAVERSINGKDFEEVGFIASKAINSSSELSYTFSDKYTNATVVYYRLKIVDVNGQYSYSSIIAIASGKIAQLQITKFFPNPVSDVLTLNIESPATTKTTITVTNVLGKVVKTTSLSVNTGATTMLIDVKNLANGNYFINVTTANGQQQSVQFVKQ